MMWRDGAAVKPDAASGSPERGRPALELAAPIHVGLSGLNSDLRRFLR